MLNRYVFCGITLIGSFLVNAVPAISQENTYTNKLGEEFYVEGDILIPKDEMNTPTTWSARTWPNGEIPLWFDGDIYDFYPHYEGLIMQACQEWGRVANIRCRKAEFNEPYYVFVEFRNGVSKAEIGFKSKQGQSFVIGHNDLSVAIHELGHTLGFEHEHVRADRDNYVTIHWDNINSNSHFEYQKTSYRQSTAYDLDSIMHYPRTTHHSQGKPAISARNGKTRFGQELRRISSTDAADARNLYGR